MSEGKPDLMLLTEQRPTVIQLVFTLLIQIGVHAQTAGQHRSPDEGCYAPRYYQDCDDDYQNVAWTELMCLEETGRSAIV